MTEQQSEDRNGRIITFYSYKGGTGRTMALANTAWILAANGFRVLMVDWDLEAPGLAQFFGPFLDAAAKAAPTGVIELIRDYYEETLQERPHEPGWHRDFARVREHAVSINWPYFPESGRLDFLSAGQVDSDYGDTVAAMNWGAFYDEQQGSLFFEAMREDMRSHYDYVLIDSRTGLSDIAGICTVEMPDDLVVCFTLSGQSITGASNIARRVTGRYGARNIRVLPVPMRVDEGEKERADAGRAVARLSFPGLPEGFNEEQSAQYWGSVEIPYRPFYAYEEILAAFGDQTAAPSSMLAACERLVAAITQDRVSSLPSMPEELRLRYARLFTRQRPSIGEEIHISFAPEDQMWAEWMKGLLSEAGLRVVLREAGPESEDGGGDTLGGGIRVDVEALEKASRTLVVLSPAFLRTPQAKLLNAFGDSGGLSTRVVVPVRVGEVQSGAAFGSRRVDLLRLDEHQAATALLRALGREDRDVDELLAAGTTRFPGTRPAIWNVRQRNTEFTGRSRILEALRDQLRGGKQAAVLPTPTTLYGLGGVGKTQVALEFAHRFMADYDLVWWIEAEQSDQVMLSLAELARRLDLRVGDNVAEAAEAAREALRLGSRGDRWLLIFDNADEPGAIGRYFPGGLGHVLITSRNQAWAGQAQASPVDVFTRGESIEHLTRRAPGITYADADLVADAVGDLPLAVEIAAAWLNTTGTPVADYVAELQQEAVKALTVTQDVVPDYPQRFGAAWKVSVTKLREQSPAAARMLQLTAYFSADPISTELIYSDQMVALLLPYDKDLQVKVMLGKVVQAITRYGLAKVDLRNKSFQVHRMVQAVIRSEMDHEAQEAAKHEVHRILAGARPLLGDVDDWENWPAYEQVWPHLGPSEVQDCDEPDPRQLLVDRVRYLYRRGELAVAEDLARRLDEAWTRKLGARDRQTLLLRFQLANVLRSQGKFEEALEMDRDTLERQRAELGPDHLYTLMTAGSLAGDLRSLGRFDEALALDQETHAKSREIFGEQNVRTLMLGYNLALDYRFTGDYEAARGLDQETLEIRTTVLGPKHQDTQTTKAALAEDLRALGDYTTSVQLLSEFQEEYSEVPVTDLPTLRYAKSYAVALRRIGRQAEAARITRQTYEAYREGYGLDAPDALACALNLAADYSAAGDKERARDLAADVNRSYRRSLGPEHPFTLASANNVAIYLRDCGQVEEAVALAENTMAAMRRVLGPRHPYSLATLLNLANCYGDAGELTRSEALGLEALEGLAVVYGARHPDVLVCRGNLAVTLRAAGRVDEAKAMRDEVLGQLTDQLGELAGEEHPAIRAIRGWKRNSRDLELQPA